MATQSGENTVDNEFTRDPSDYRPSDHALQRMNERNVSGEAVSQTIINGRVAEKRTDESGDNHGVVLTDKYLGVDYSVVIVPPKLCGGSSGLVKTCWVGTP